LKWFVVKTEVLTTQITAGFLDQVMV